MRGRHDRQRWRTQIIGAAGELLVQYQLLKHEIDTARLTTDSGIDLVMYVPGTREALTVQVKAMQRPYTEGKWVYLEWGFPLNCKSGLAGRCRSVTRHGMAITD